MSHDNGPRNDGLRWRRPLRIARRNGSEARQCCYQQQLLSCQATFRGCTCLPQIPRIGTEPIAREEAPTDFTDANFRGCTCLKCTNRAILIYILLRWCTSCSGKRQSRAETSAPPEVSSICADPCNPWENNLSKNFCEIRGFRGRIYAASRYSCYSCSL